MINAKQHIVLCFRFISRDTLLVSLFHLHVKKKFGVTSKLLNVQHILSTYFFIFRRKKKQNQTILSLHAYTFKVIVLFKVNYDSYMIFED